MSAFDEIVDRMTWNVLNCLPKDLFIQLTEKSSGREMDALNDAIAAWLKTVWQGDT